MESMQSVSTSDDYDSANEDFSEDECFLSEDIKNAVLEIVKNTAKFSEQAKTVSEQFLTILKSLDKKLSIAKRKDEPSVKEMHDKIDKLQQDFLEAEIKHQVKTEELTEKNKYCTDQLIKVNYLEENISIDKRKDVSNLKEIHDKIDKLQQDFLEAEIKHQVKTEELTEKNKYCTDQLIKVNYLEENISIDKRKDVSSLKEIHDKIDKLQQDFLEAEIKHQVKTEELTEKNKYCTDQLYKFNYLEANISKILLDLEKSNNENQLLKEENYENSLKINELNERIIQFPLDFSSLNEHSMPEISKLLESNKYFQYKLEQIEEDAVEMKKEYEDTLFNIQELQQNINKIEKTKNNSEEQIKQENKKQAEQILKLLKEMKIFQLELSVLKNNEELFKKNCKIQLERVDTLYEKVEKFSPQFFISKEELKQSKEEQNNNIKILKHDIDEMKSEIFLLREQENDLKNFPCRIQPLEENNNQINLVLSNYKNLILDINKIKAEWAKEALNIWHKLLTNSLLKASLENQLNFVTFILNLGADVNSQSDDGITALHNASKKGHLSIVTELIQHWAKESKDKTGMTPLNHAACNGHISVVKELIQNMSNIESKDNMEKTSLHLAAQNGHVSVVKELIENKANIESKDKDEVTPLNRAAVNGHLDVVIELIKNKANIEVKDKMGKTSLHRASQNGHLSVVKELLENKADIESKDAEGWTPLHLAAWFGTETFILNELISNNANIYNKNKTGMTALHLAADCGNTANALELMKRYSDLNMKSLTEQTPLHYAAKKGNVAIVIGLLKSGANIDSKDQNGWTPLHLAAFEGRLGVVTELIKHGVKIDSKVKESYTPLHLAAGQGHVEVIKELIKNKTNIEIKDKDGWTPLHIAARYGQMNVITELIVQGANIMAKAKDGNTPLDVAKINNQTEVINFLNQLTG